MAATRALAAMLCTSPLLTMHFALPLWRPLAQHSSRAGGASICMHPSIGMQPWERHKPSGLVLEHVRHSACSAATRSTHCLLTLCLACTLAGYQAKRIDNTSRRDEPFDFVLGQHQVRLGASLKQPRHMSLTGCARKDCHLSALLGCPVLPRVNWGRAGPVLSI